MAYLLRVDVEHDAFAALTDEQRLQVQVRRKEVVDDEERANAIAEPHARRIHRNPQERAAMILDGREQGTRDGVVDEVTVAARQGQLLAEREAVHPGVVHHLVEALAAKGIGLGSVLGRTIWKRSFPTGREPRSMGVRTGQPHGQIEFAPTMRDTIHERQRG